MRSVFIALGLVAGLAAPLSAQAQDFQTQNFQDQDLQAGNMGLKELRAGVFFHSAYRGFIPTNADNFDFSSLEDISFSALFASPDIDAFRWIGSPRPEIGATVSLTGRESFVHANLNWQFGLGDTPFYLELGLGGALNNGQLTGAVAPARNMGCALNFYESAGLGMHLNEQVTATLRYEHTSNLGLCDANDGLSNLGLMIGFKF